MHRASRPSRQSSPAKPTAGGALPLHVMRSESIFVTVSGLRREAVRPAVDVDDAADEAVAHHAVADDAERELVRVARRRVADARVVQHEARVLDDLRERGGGSGDVVHDLELGARRADGRSLRR